MKRFIIGLLCLGAALAGCGEDRPEERAPSEEGATITGVEPYGLPRPISPEELERGRFDTSWRQVVQLDTVPFTDSVPNTESWDDISAETVNELPIFLPLHGDVAGPSVLKVQILLDRALFSPGVIDGRWGMNTEKAIYWLQRREGLPATGQMDLATYDRLVSLAENPGNLINDYRLTAEDVSGPFVTIPDTVYAQAELECMCYQSLTEKLGEMFHVTPELLAQLNPGVDLNRLSAGDVILIPNIRNLNVPAAAPVSTIVVSDLGHYVHALDASGRILYHFPSTLGSEYAPSPTGDFRVTAIAESPWWHYKPELLTGVPDSLPDARIPPGPNNAVGVVWMDLSVPHFGIHGTSAPETIGYVTSHGCVRLTNWDALFLADRITEGTPVRFRDS